MRSTRAGEPGGEAGAGRRNKANLRVGAAGEVAAACAGIAACGVSIPRSAKRTTGDSDAIVIESQVLPGACRPGAGLPGARWQGGTPAGSAHLTTHCAPGTRPAATAIARNNTAALIDLTRL